MLCLRKPTEEELATFLEQQANTKISHGLVNGTLEHHMKEEFENDPKFQQYNIDQHRIFLGTGESCYLRAIEGLRSWKQFSLTWVEIFPPDAPLMVGTDIAIVAKSMGVWTASACRICTVIEHETFGKFKRFGFAYGTLEVHLEVGEERFLIEWNTETNEVFFDILAFSQHNTWFTKLGHPVARYFQDCFGKDATQALHSWTNYQQDLGKVDVTIV